MDKSPEAFRTISEVADFLDTPAHVLRFWESRFPQIRPVKRAGGRRYYRPGDVALLAGIKKLLHDEGLTIRGVQKILREQGIRHVASLGSGDASTAVLDSDIEAVLSAEYGLPSRPAVDDRLSPEALQSAQIISLETALNRQEGARQAAPVQPELWPPAPPDMPSDHDEAEAWPGDPEDVGGAEAEQEPAFVGDGEPAFAPASEDQGAASSVPEAAAAETDTAPQDGPEQTAEVALPEGEASSASGIPEAEVVAVDSSPATAEVGTDGADEEPTATVAALLRRVSPGQIAAVQPDLIALRDRLIDLRGRVAEAARRRAK